MTAQPPRRLPAPDQTIDPATDQMLAMLQQMVAKDPGRADSWRLIGRIYRKQNRVPEAVEVLRRALSLQPDNVAAHSDLGELMAQVGDHRAASYHFDQVMMLAPSSGYAAKLVERGIRPAPNMATEATESDSTAMLSQQFSEMPNSVGRSNENIDGAGNVNTVGYEIQTFDGAEDLDRRLHQLESDAIAAPKRTRAFIEFGTLYNTNVSLTPISRGLTNVNAASYQGFFSPDLEWIALGQGPWRSGPLLRGYFTKNEDSFQSLNLASFQPGAFVERDIQGGANQMIGRVDYVYSLDLLDGDRFGQRHAITASLTTILPEAEVIYAYFTTSLSDFAQDGANPSVDSLDGTALSAGISRFYRTNWWFLPTWTLGVDGEWADTEGADFRYQAINLHGDTTFQITSWLSFIPRAGIGYRNYGDFTGPVNRNELTSRVSGKLRWQCSESLSVSGIVGHDRFASDNEDFDSKRTEAGIVVTVLR